MFDEFVPLVGLSSSYVPESRRLYQLTTGPQVLYWRLDVGGAQMRRRDPSKDSGNRASLRADYSIDLSVLHNLMTSHPSHHQWPLATQTISSPLMTLCTYVNNSPIDAFTVHAKTPFSQPANLIPELCRGFYHLGWVTGTGGGISIRVA